VARDGADAVSGRCFPAPLGVRLAGKAAWPAVRGGRGGARKSGNSATDRHRRRRETTARRPVPAWCCARGRAGRQAIDAADVKPRIGRALLMRPARSANLTQSRVRNRGPGRVRDRCGRFEWVDKSDQRGPARLSRGGGVFFFFFFWSLLGGGGGGGFGRGYVLSGGEIRHSRCWTRVRMLQGVMGRLESGSDESFSEDTEYPQFTRQQGIKGIRPRKS